MANQGSPLLDQVLGRCGNPAHAEFKLVNGKMICTDCGLPMESE